MSMNTAPATPRNVTFHAYRTDPNRDAKIIRNGDKVRDTQLNRTPGRPAEAIQALETVGITPPKKLVDAWEEAKQARSGAVDIQPERDQDTERDMTSEQLIEWLATEEDRRRYNSAAHTAASQTKARLYREACALCHTEAPKWFDQMKTQLDGALADAIKARTAKKPNLGDTLATASIAGEMWERTHTAAATLRQNGMFASLERAYVNEYRYGRPDHVHRWALDNATGTTQLERRTLRDDIELRVTAVWERANGTPPTPTIETILENYDQWEPSLYDPTHIATVTYPAIEAHETKMATQLERWAK